MYTCRPAGSGAGNPQDPEDGKVGRKVLKHIQKNSSGMFFFLFFNNYQDKRPKKDGKKCGRVGSVV